MERVVRSDARFRPRGSAVFGQSASGPSGGGGTLLLPWQFSEVTRYWDARYAVTSSAERVSAWDDLKLGTQLAQGTGANQPYLLPWSGVNYLWLPDVSGNDASTPNAVPLNITGNIEIEVDCAINSVTPADHSSIVDKIATGGQQAYAFNVQQTSGKLVFSTSNTGTGTTNAVSTAALGDVGIAAYQRVSLKVTKDVATGDVKFYYSTNGGSSFTQLGDTVAVAAETTFAGTSVLYIGSRANSFRFPGKIYQAIIRSGIGGTVAFNADFTAVPEGATSFTESSENAATVTINSTGVLPAQIVGSQQVLFEPSAAQFLQAAFTLAQPMTLLLCMSQPTQQNQPIFVDGIDASHRMTIGKSPGANENYLYAGSVNNCEVTGVETFTQNIYAGVFNGASSQLQINLGTPATGNPGTNDADGITLGKFSGGAGYEANMQVKTLALCESALAQAQINQLIRAMAAQSELPL